MENIDFRSLNNFDFDAAQEFAKKADTIAKQFKIMRTWSPEQIDQVFNQLASQYASQNEVRDLLFQYWEDIRNDKNILTETKQEILIE